MTGDRESVRYQIIDVFTSTPFEGNPAGVVLNSTELTSQVMQKIAREINISNTAFLSKDRMDGDFGVRFFTPEREIPICGHSTIAVFFAWIMEEELGSDTEMVIVKQENSVGVLPVYVRLLEGRPDNVSADLPRPTFKRSPLSQNEVCKTLHLREEHMGDYPTEIVHNGLQFLVIGVKNLKTLLRLSVPSADLTKLSEELGVDCVQFFTMETSSPDCTVSSRTFFPILGVFEDPVCGTGNAALASYLVKNEIIQIACPTTRIVGEQGHCVSRPGKVHVLVDISQGNITRVRIRGKAVKVMEGDIFLRRDKTFIHPD